MRRAVVVFRLDRCDRALLESVVRWMRFFAVMYVSLWTVLTLAFFGLFWTVGTR